MNKTTFEKIKDTADCIKNLNMNYDNIIFTLNRTRPENVDPMDWAASVALYLAHDAGGIYTAEE